MGKKIDVTGWKMWEHGVPDSRLTVIKEHGKTNMENICGNVSVTVEAEYLLFVERKI